MKSPTSRSASAGRPGATKRGSCQIAKSRRIPVPGIAGNEVQRDVFLAGRRGWQFDPQFLRGGDGSHRLLPGFRAADLADVSHAGESPDGLLPLTDFGGNLRRISRPTGPPVRPNLIEQQRRLAIGERVPENAEVFGIQPVFRSDGGDRIIDVARLMVPRLGATPTALRGRASNVKRIRTPTQSRGRGTLIRNLTRSGPRVDHTEPFRHVERRSHVAFNRQPAAVVGVEDDPLQIHLRSAGVIRVFAIDRANLSQDVVRPVGTRDRRRETESVRQQYGVLGDLASRVEVFRQQGRRHDERVARVGEAFAGRPVGRKIAGRIEVDPRQVADRIGVFGIAQTPQHDGSRIAGPRQRLGMQVALDPARSCLRSALVGCLASLGGISPLSSISATLSQTFVSRRMSLSDAKRSRSKSPFCLAVEWQLRQTLAMSGRTSRTYSEPTSVNSDGTFACV